MARVDNTGGAGYVIDNGTGAAVRTKLNQITSAINSINSGSGDPSINSAFQPHIDTSSSLFKIRNAANNAYVTIGNISLDNLGHVVSFRRPDDALIHLERDDLGTINDTYYDADGNLVYLKENRETVAIRTNEPRNYLVTIHFYNARKNPAPLVHATVKLIKINPYREEYHKKLFFSQEGQELPAMVFRIDYNGNVDVGPTEELIIRDEVVRKEGA